MEATEILNDHGQPRPIYLFMLGTLLAQGGEELSNGALHRGAGGWGLGLRTFVASLSAQVVGYDYLTAEMAEMRGDGSFADLIAKHLVSDDLATCAVGFEDGVANPLRRRSI